MLRWKSRAALAVILVLTTVGAFAQAPTQTPSVPTAPTMPMGYGMPMMGGTPMMGMMQMMGGQWMAAHVEGRIAFLKAELKITDAQLPLWNAVADVIRGNAMATGDTTNGTTMMQSATPLPDRFAAREKWMTERLEALRKLKTAVEPLYAALDTDQKKTADELMIGLMGMGMMGMGMMGMGMMGMGMMGMGMR